VVVCLVFLGCDDGVQPLVTSLVGEPVPIQVTGTIQVNVVTTGDDPDPDGYVVRAGDGDGQRIGPNHITTFDVGAGPWAVRLGGLAANCFVEEQSAGGDVRHVEVIAGGTAFASFAVTCEAIFTGQPLPAGTQLAFVRHGSIYLVEADGTVLLQLTEGTSDTAPAWSPDGRLLAFVRENGESSDIYITNSGGAPIVRRTLEGRNEDPSWSPDGKRIAYASLSNGSMNVFTMSAVDDGAGSTLLVGRPGWDAQPAWSPDGAGIAYASDWLYYDGASDIYVAAPDGSQITQLTTLTGFTSPLIQYFQPAWSPDGQRLAVVTCVLAYVTCGGGTTLSVMEADGSELTSLASARGWAGPSWSPDGQILAYSHAGSIRWIRANGLEGGTIIDDGHSPAWRP
jgi:Tol biopolymer transport system component